MKRTPLWLGIGLAALALAAAVRAASSDVVMHHAALDSAQFSFDGRTLRVSTGRMEREWVITPDGMRTVAVLLATATQARWSDGAEPASGADWKLDLLIPNGAAAHLDSLDAKTDDDDGFTSAHLDIVATFSYGDGASVRYEIWAYPGAPGLRTQLWVRGAAVTGVLAGPARVDQVPVGDGGPGRLVAFGYYNDTQHRNGWDRPILREEVRALPAAEETIDWASAAAVERPGAGVLLLKESQKCVNQAGTETGAWVVGPATIANTGLRLRPGDLRRDRYRWAWATWCLAYDGTDQDRERAVKGFYSVRYPIDAARDVYSEANTFGSGGSDQVDSLTMAREDQVLAELGSIADLGVDRLQIDAGWSDPKGWRATKVWRPAPALYPEGWSRIAARAQSLHVGLGLWAPSMTIPLNDLEWNYTTGGFLDWKLDFARLATADAIDANLDKVRAYVAFTHHRAQIVWDLTENAPRYGYYWAREYGGGWLANRKPAVPANAVYQPAVLLRDVWQLGRYVNLNKVQIAVQNPKRVDAKLSDAHLYRADYCAAIGLAGIPLFFGTTRFYAPGDRAAIRTLLARWKRQREAMFASTEFPIGDCPSGRSWTGFQFRHSADDGYLLIFREADNPDRDRTLPLRFLGGRTGSLEDLRTGGQRTVTFGTDGRCSFAADRPGDFLFLRYRCLPGPSGP